MLLTVQPMIDWPQLEALIRRDPGGRGLASYRDAAGRPLLPHELERAAQQLAEFGTRVLIVTGFCVVTEQRVTAETDGPPGALFLAGMLQAAGIEAFIAVDRFAAPLVRAGLEAAGLEAAGLEAAGLPQSLLIEFPQTTNDAPARAAVAQWRHEHALSAKQFSHIVFIEHVGPSHTRESVERQTAEPRRAEVVAEFERLVPSAERDVCHNMRGVSIDAHTGPLHELISPDQVARSGPPRPTSIGIVDGGNEIGCGALPWDVARRAIAQGPAPLIVCRIATDYTIVSGVSNWGGYALGAAVAALRDRPEALAAWTADRQRAILESLVAAGAVDGVTKLPQATVDALPPADYFALFDEIRRLCLAAD